MDLGLAASNIVLTGGNANFPRYQERFERELRSFVPGIHPIAVRTPENPELFAWKSMVEYERNERKSGTLGRSMVSKWEYTEYGHSFCNERFSKW